MLQNSRGADEHRDYPYTTRSVYPLDLRRPDMGLNPPRTRHELRDGDVVRGRYMTLAEAADADGRPWEWSGGYPQTVTRTGDAMLIANTFEGPDFPSTIAEFIATFDPPTVLALLRALNEKRGHTLKIGRASCRE